MHPKYLSIKDYTYQLPEGRIAKYPLAERDKSKLLVYKDLQITEDTYSNLAQHIPQKTLLIFNNTRVIQARLWFYTATGAKVEVFCLEPVTQAHEIVTAMNRTGTVRWKCMVGRASKWKEKILTKKENDLILTAELADRDADSFIVEFKWQPAGLTFAEVLEKAGVMPIPPYFHREAEEVDRSRYQTVYAKHEGSVAAPTAGLHFTDAVFQSMAQRNIETAYVTLHVGAGTFKPVKSETMQGHDMHYEWIEVSAALIRQVLNALGQTIIAVGTTSLRTMETLYWMGLKAHLNPNAAIGELEVHQWDAYDINPVLSTTGALNALLKWMEKNEPGKLFCKTQIMIAPGYSLRIADGLITNFHQPGSTLLLLVAGIIGEDWRNIYGYALAHNFRFLSYGDGSLLFANKKAPRE